MKRDFMKERGKQLAGELTQHSDTVIDQIRPLLANRSQLLQGAVIAELAAIYIAGHRPELRREMLKIHVDTLLQMIALHDPWEKTKND